MPALDLQNLDLTSLLQMLGGFSGANQITQPPLQSMGPPPPQAFGGSEEQASMPGQDAPQQNELNPQMAAQIAGNAEPPRNLGQTFPQNFQGMGLGDTAPKVNQAKPQLDLQQLMMLLSNMQGANMGGF